MSDLEHKLVVVFSLSLLACLLPSTLLFSLLQLGSSPARPGCVLLLLFLLPMGIIPVRAPTTLLPSTLLLLPIRKPLLTPHNLLIAIIGRSCLGHPKTYRFSRGGLIFDTWMADSDQRVVLILVFLGFLFRAESESGW